MKTYFTRFIPSSIPVLLSSLFMTGCAAWLPQESPPEAQDVPIVAAEKTNQSEYDRKEQSPGFFRMRLGHYFVTALYDGSMPIDSQLMKGRPQTTITRLLLSAKQPQEVSTAINAFLLDDGQNIILVDTGASAALGDGMGKLLSSLNLSGYSPQDINVVLLTHLHPDHVGGLLNGSSMSFPNAQVYAPDSEAAHWLSAERTNGNLPLFKGALETIAPYSEAGKFHVFEAGSSPVPGIESVALTGHSPGHSGYRIKSESESLLIWGDIVQNHITQFADPSIALEFDNNQRAARNTRAKVLREAANSGEWIAGSHLPFPGIGRVQSTGKTSYRWLPIDYSMAMTQANQRQPGRIR